MNTSIKDIRKDRIAAQEEIVEILRKFESKYGQVISSAQYLRWNGSNRASGKISQFAITISI